MDILYLIIQNIVNPLIYVLIGLAVVYFLWGVFIFVKNADDPEKRKVGAQHILWGIVGIAIIFSAFTFVSVIQNTIGRDSRSPTINPEILGR